MRVLSFVWDISNKIASKMATIFEKIHVHLFNPTIFGVTNEAWTRRPGMAMVVVVRFANARGLGPYGAHEVSISLIYNPYR